MNFNIKEIFIRCRLTAVISVLRYVPLLIGGIIFFFRIEGALILITELFALVSAFIIHNALPYSRVIAISHMWWIPTLPILIYRALTETHQAYFSPWLWYAIVIMIISVIIDIKDIYKFLYTEDRYYR